MYRCPVSTYIKDYFLHKTILSTNIYSSCRYLSCLQDWLKIMIEKENKNDRNMWMHPLHYPSPLLVRFATKEINYDLRIKNLLQIPKVKKFSYGESSLLFRSSTLWNILPDSIKWAWSVKRFKTRIKTGRKEMFM